MFTAIRIFNKQVKQYKTKGLVKSPYKYFFRWRASLINGANSVKDEKPWITFNAIDYLENYVNQNSEVFEFGGGGSTLFFLKKGATVFTVEHDQKWFEILGKVIAEKNYTKWTGYFIEPEKGKVVENPEKANPLHFYTDDEHYLNFHFKNYATKIQEFPDNGFDVVLVDGRSRSACIYQSVSKIKKGGLLVLDNSDRNYYTSENQKLIKDNFNLVFADYAPSPYTREFTQTTIWVKK